MNDVERVTWRLRLIRLMPAASHCIKNVHYDYWKTSVDKSL